MATSMNPRLTPRKRAKAAKTSALASPRTNPASHSDGGVHLSQVIPGRHLSGIEAAGIVERGLPASSVESLRNWGLTFTEVHELVLPARTLKHRIQKKQPLTMEETDRAIRIAKVLALADHVFGDHDRALKWLRHTSRRLQDRRPLQLLRSGVGGELVTEMLYQLDEGMVV
ncbi:MAG TPA: antitoxin Xre/MbcA/ParS toxin-binding domain-containing protein [Acidisarcina sp.]